MQEKDTRIWREKLDWIAQCGGMALVVSHPDYMNFNGERPAINEYPASYYRNFLTDIKENYKDQYWHVLPGQMAHFWTKNHSTKGRNKYCGPVKTDHPLITVVTVVFNGEKYIENTLLSVINQTYGKIQYIIIDGKINGPHP